MKIIKDSNKKKQPVQVSCSSCQSVLEVSPSDVVINVSDRDGNAHVFECAVCHFRFFVDVSVTGW